MSRHPRVSRGCLDSRRYFSRFLPHSTAVRLPKARRPWYDTSEVIPMYELDKARFGSFVAQLRKEKGLTQKALAQQLFISDKAVSKWETGVSVPDTALLIPLAEALGVTVTELLQCRRQPVDVPLKPEAVEQVVKTAVLYGEDKPRRAWRTMGRWPLWYGLSLVLGAAGLWANWRLGTDMEALWAPVILGAFFGAYFCFFVRTNLPPFYDQYRLGMVQDGMIRMNIPGVSFNNRNWPHIITVVRCWACLTMVLLPLVALGIWALDPAAWAQLALAVVLVLTLGGLFVPLIITGRRWA